MSSDLQAQPVNMHRRSIRDARFIALLMSPTIILVGAVSLFPMAYAIYVSLHTTRYLEIGSFIGLGNFVALFRDPSTVQGVIVTLKYVLGSLTLALSLGMLLATILNRPLRFISVFRTLVLLPWILSQVVVAMLWAWVLEPSFGPVNYILREVGLGKVFFLALPNMAPLTLIGTNVWMSFPLPTVLLLAALQTVPPELYEAARIDGANAWQCFTRITLPLILSTFLVAMITLTLFYFNMVTLILVLTGGGPLQMTEVVSLRAYYEAFSNFRMGHATALGVTILFCNGIFSIAYLGIIKREAAF